MKSDSTPLIEANLCPKPKTKIARNIMFIGDKPIPKIKNPIDGKDGHYIKYGLRIDANRQNALKSTGPQTEEGKKKVSQNAVKHGLYAKNIIIDSPHLQEDPEEYEALLNSFLEDLKPVGNFQKQLVIKLVNCIWRYQRLIVAENAEINDQLGPRPIEIVRHLSEPGFDVPAISDDPQRINYNRSQCIPRQNSSPSLLRYERHLDLQIWRTFKMLRSLQYQNQQTTPPPLICRNKPNSPSFQPKNEPEYTPQPPQDPSPNFELSPPPDPPPQTFKCTSIRFD